MLAMNTIPTEIIIQTLHFNKIQQTARLHIQMITSPILAQGLSEVADSPRYPKLVEALQSLKVNGLIVLSIIRLFYVVYSQAPEFIFNNRRNSYAELYEGLKLAQRGRLEDQRGTEIKFEMPDFLKREQQV